MKTINTSLLALLSVVFLAIAGSPVAFADDDEAPANATYILQTPNRHLKRAEALSGLATGVLKNTTGTGVITIATPGVDYVTAAQVQALTSTVNSLQGLVATLQGQVAT